MTTQQVMMQVPLIGQKRQLQPGEVFGALLHLTEALVQITAELNTTLTMFLWTTPQEMERLHGLALRIASGYEVEQAKRALEDTATAISLRTLEGMPALHLAMRNAAERRGIIEEEQANQAAVNDDDDDHDNPSEIITP